MAKYFPVVLRNNITNILDRVFPPDTSAFARALLLGDSSRLTYEQETDFQTTGIRHVIAVSGLHVSILFSVLIMLFKGRAPLLALFGFPLLFLFAAVAGFTPSIVRACLMQMLVVLALLFSKEYDPPTALSCSALVMLAVMPHTITSVSFQLSVGCMIGMFLFNERIVNYLLDEKRFGPAKGKSLRSRVIRWVVGSVSATVSAMIITTPLCAYYFGSVSLIGMLTNLLTLWVISFIFYGIMLACILGAFFAPLGMVVAWIVAWPIRFVLFVVDLLGAFPLASVYVNSIYIVLWLIFSYVLLAVFLKCRQKQPLVLLMCVTVLLCAALTASWAEARVKNYQITVLNVGQGACILLQSEERCYMVDCGGDSDETAADMAAQALLSQGIAHLDGVIVTHYDADHVNGVPLLLTRIPADVLYLPDTPDDSGIKEKLLQSYADKVQWVKDNTVIRYEDTQLSLFPSKDSKTDNERSVCVLFQAKNCDILITGDRNITGEQALLETTTLPKLEVLIVGHHGSKNSTGLALLEATQPDIAIISVGENNAFGHPNKDVLSRLQMIECTVYRTDELGTVVLRG